MQPAGLRAFEARDEQRSGIYSFEQRADPKLTREQTARFRAETEAWAFFQAQPPGYRRLAIWWVVSAKREETRERRLAALIADSAKGLRLPQFRRE
jgi:uncharacterized protein YdeI (YjbR/CyaY-like superfamily)